LSANGRYVAFVSFETLTGLSTTKGETNIYRFDRVTGDLALVTVNSSGTGSGSGDSYDPAISADGSVVVFASRSSNLHPLDTDTGSDIFARNFITGTTELVSINSAGTGSGNGDSHGPGISADGTVVTFYSTSNNLHPLDTVTGTDVFARNLTTGTTYLVSVNSGGTGGGNGTSDSPVISADGSVVTFRSQARNLSPLKTTSTYYDLFARNLTTNTTYLVSVNSAGTGGGNGDSDSAVISADGSVVAFRSYASNLHSSDNNGKSDIFARSLMAGTTHLVSVNSAGTGSGNNTSDSPVMSADGSVVAYRSSASDLHALDTNSSYDIYVRNLVSNSTELASVNLMGTASGVADGPVISADGTVVLFSSFSSNLHPLDTSASSDIFARNLLTETTILVSINSAGTASGNARSEAWGFKLLGVSADGSVVSFHSEASDLVTGDFNGERDLFVRNLVGGTTQLVSTFDGGSPSTTGGNNSTVDQGALSADGRYVVFVSRSANLIDGLDIWPSTQNVYRMDRVTGHIDLVSVNVDGTGSGNDDSGDPVISADGSVVAFSSDASNLVSLLSGGGEIFVRNFVTGTTQLVSVRTDGAQGGNGSSDDPTISADGSVVAFSSNASNLHPLDTNTTKDIFARNLVTGTTYLVSISSDGAAGGNHASYVPVMSSNGKVVTFLSASSNLHPAKSSATGNDIFARDLETGITSLVSINSTGDSPLNGSFYLQRLGISANGNVVVFRSDFGTVYARNLATNTTIVVGTGSLGTINGTAFGFVISADGSVVAFHSTSSLHPLDTNGRQDVYARNIVTGTTYLVSVNSTGTANGNGDSEDPAISADGSVVAFRSKASNLHDLKTSQLYEDTFARNLLTGRTYLLSANMDGTGSGNDDSWFSSSVVSADGRVVAFSSDARNLVPDDYNSSTDVFAVTIPTVTPPIGDYNGNYAVDAADYVLWRKTLGTTGVPAYFDADGDGDATIDQDDYVVWQAHFGQTAAGAGSGAATSSLSEPMSGEFSVSAPSNSVPAEANSVPVPTANLGVLEMPSRRQESASRARRQINHDRWSESISDDLLMLAIDRVGRDPRPDSLDSGLGGKNDHHADDDNNGSLESDEPLAVALAEWRRSRCTSK
jgi:hypothetical protein